MSRHNLLTEVACLVAFLCEVVVVVKVENKICRERRCYDLDGEKDDVAGGGTAASVCVQTVHRFANKTVRRFANKTVRRFAYTQCNPAIDFRTTRVLCPATRLTQSTNPEP